MSWTVQVTGMGASYSALPVLRLVPTTPHSVLHRGQFAPYCKIQLLDLLLFFFFLFFLSTRKTEAPQDHLCGG